MRAIDVGIGHDDNLVVTKFAEVGFLRVVFGTDSHAERLKHVDDFFAVEHAVFHSLLHVEDFTA